MDVKTLIDKASERAGNQTRLAEKLDTTTGRVSDYKTGRVHCTVPTLLKLCAIAGVSDADTLALVRAAASVTVPKRSRGVAASFALAVIAFAGIAGTPGTSRAASVSYEPKTDNVYYVYYRNQFEKRSN